MATVCFCGATFATVEGKHAHAASLGHLFECYCGTTVASRNALMNHKRDVAHTHKGKSDRFLDLDEPHTDPRKCGLCVKKPPFKDQGARDHHIADKHQVCPTCAQVFDQTADRLRHQKATNHCYCAQHNEAFKKSSAYDEHRRADLHISSFECTDCQRAFSSDKALDQHLISDGHAKVVARTALEEAEWQATVTKKALREESNLYCEACNKKFIHLRAFRQHKDSLKHKSLSELKCPISNTCTGMFSSPSALIFHLESGGCKSGMTRNKLNAVVYQHDGDRYITSTAHVTRVRNTVRSEVSHGSIAPGSSASNRARTVSVSSSCDGRTGSVTYTPEGSEAASALKSEGRVTPTDGASPSAVDSETELYKLSSASDTSSIGKPNVVDFTPAGSEVAGTSKSKVHAPSHNCDSHSAAGSKTEFYVVSSASDTWSTVNGECAIPTTPPTVVGSPYNKHKTSASDFSDGSVNFTPPESFAGSGACSDWSFLSSRPFMTPSSTSVGDASVDTIAFDTASNRWPCQICEQTFSKMHDLVQHIDSVAHAPKIFHCPTNLPGLPGSRKPTITFKTLSGLAQHVEAGSCNGGKETLGLIVGIFEKQIHAKLGKSVKLLKE